MKVTSKSLLLVSGLLAALGCVGGTVQDRAFKIRVDPMPEWEALFRDSNPRWRGADAIYTTPLSPDRILWLFGDTWIVPAEAGGREGGTMIRNSLAVQSIGESGAGEPEFHWRTVNGKARAPFGETEEDEPWLWPLSAIRIGPELAIFVTRLIGSDEGMGFESTGSAMIVVSNPDDPPERWEQGRIPIPFYRHSRNGDLIFGLSSLLIDATVYIYGMREDWRRGIGGREIILGRVPMVALRRGDFTAWEFWMGEGWNRNLAEAAALFDGAAAEMSVSYLPGLDRYAAVYTEFGLSDKIMARFAPNPEGPFGRAYVLYRCPDVKWNKRYFCYAAKAHPELARRGNELIVTYATNSSDFADHGRDMRIYWPRFVRVTMEP